MSSACINLSGMTTLLADSDHFTRGLTSQILRGFGAEPCTIVDTGAEAIQLLSHSFFDMCVMEAKLPDLSCVDLIRWIRRQKDNTARFVPILVLSSYTQLRHVSAARDAGANMVARKPISPQVLFDRVTWIGRVARPFVEAGDYIGPDRRFNNRTPPNGAYRRDTDDPAAIDAAGIPEDKTDSNMRVRP